MTQKADNWRTWETDDRGKPYGEMFFKRATGALPEMECSKAAARRLAAVLKQGERLLDVGCGAGHYYRSLKASVRSEFHYMGLDATSYYVQRAREAYAGDHDAQFAVGDIFNIEFPDKSFDIALCSNVLTHLPSVAKPIHELCRVARRYLLVRTLVADKSYVVMDVAPDENGADFDDNGAPSKFVYLNIYGELYLRHLLGRIPRVREVTIEPDREFTPDRITDTAEALPKLWGLTTVVEGVQRNGPILLPWCWIAVGLDPA